MSILDLGEFIENNETLKLIQNADYIFINDYPDGSDSEDDSKGPAELAKDEEEDDEEEDDEEYEEESEEEEEVESIEISGTEYFTNDSKIGNIYEVGDDGDPGDKVGWFENGIAFFS